MRALGGDAAPVALLEAGSADELTAALRRAHELTDRLVFLQVHTAPLDVPAQLAALGRPHHPARRHRVTARRGR